MVLLCLSLFEGFESFRRVVSRDSRLRASDCLVCGCEFVLSVFCCECV